MTIRRKEGNEGRSRKRLDRRGKDDFRMCRSEKRKWAPEKEITTMQERRQKTAAVFSCRQGRGILHGTIQGN
jgi:hypothetical protein